VRTQRPTAPSGFDEGRWGTKQTTRPVEEDCAALFCEFQEPSHYRCSYGATLADTIAESNTAPTIYKLPQKHFGDLREIMRLRYDRVPAPTMNNEHTADNATAASRAPAQTMKGVLEAQ
jgi:hypothetical protein